MRIGLAAYRSENGNIGFNLSQIEKALAATRGQVDLLVFGEAFLQGFDSLTWDPEKDLSTAVTADSAEMNRLRELSKEYGTAILTGYIEREGDRIYSSCAVILDGAMICNYRRVSPGWKEISLADQHYREGKSAPGFDLMGKHFSLALCGDLWDFPELFRTEGTLIWPVYVNYSIEDWDEWALSEYASHTSPLCREALVVNPIDRDPVNHGGAFLMSGGKIKCRLPFDTEGVLIAEPD